MEIILSKSTRADKKYMVKIDKKTIHFGASNYSDYTIHKNVERKRRYIARHKSREKWTKAGIQTAGFWSRHLLWNKPTLTASIRDINHRFNVSIVKKN